MTDSTAPKKRWFRFSLRLLLLVVLLVAVALWTGRRIYEWYYSTPLSDEVAEFNARYDDDRVGKYEPPVTEEEIVASIESQLPTLDASEAVKAIYARIARTRRLPRGASLDAIPGWSTGSGDYTVWWINLNVMTGKNRGYGLRIRENNNPAAKSADEPRLERANRSWVHEEPE